MKKIGVVSFAMTLVVITVTSCGGNGGSPAAPSTPPPPTRAVIVATVDPNPVVWVPAGTSCANRRDLASWTVTIRETGGLGGNVNYINVTSRSKSTGLEANTLNYDANEVISRAGTNHVNANGQISLRIGICANLTAFSGRQETVTQVVNFTDDRSNLMNISTVFDIL